MASRKEQKEKLRREREERERAARDTERRRRMIGYGAGGALVLAAIVALAVVLLAGGGGGAGGSSAGDVFPSGGKAPAQSVTDLAAATKDASCEVKNFRAPGRTHTQSLSERVKYKTNPPTAGNHFVNPADDGAYNEAPQDEQVVHSQEHGRVVLWVKPSLAKTARADLRALFEEDSYQMLLVPRANMPYAVAMTVWGAAPEPLGTGHVVSCKRYTPKVFDTIRAFRDQYRGKGPEPIP